MTELERKLLQMPKFEIHVHTEGASDAATYYALAQRHGIELPQKDLQSYKQYFEFIDFPHFIEVYVSAVKLLNTPEDFTFLVEEFYGHQARQNIVYTEAFLSATYMAGRFDHEEILEALALGRERGKEKYGVEVCFIPDVARQEPESQHSVLELVKKGFDKGVFLGLGVGGLEIGYPPELFTETFRKARDHGMHVVAHAGEGVGPESVWGALRSLKAERIGHGVRSIEDPDLLAYLKDTQVPMEVNPVSNYCLGIVKKGEPHPIRQMVDAGLCCTVNSDDPAMFSTSLTNEYLLLSEQGFSWEELVQLNRNALEASFLEEEEKVKYRAMLDMYLE